MPRLSARFKLRPMMVGGSLRDHSEIGTTYSTPVSLYSPSGVRAYVIARQIGVIDAQSHQRFMSVHTSKTNSTAGRSCCTSIRRSLRVDPAASMWTCVPIGQLVSIGSPARNVEDLTAAVESLVAMSERQSCGNPGRSSGRWHCGQGPPGTRAVTVRPRLTEMFFTCEPLVTAKWARHDSR